MPRFTYEQELTNNEVTVVTIKETGGVFIGHTLEEVVRVAEDLYPNYQTHNMTLQFSDIYFNYCLRKTLEGQPIPKEYSKNSFKNMYCVNNIKQNINDSDLEEQSD